jgi:hypothetical protein
MERGMTARILALALVLSPILGCGGGGGGSGGGGPAAVGLFNSENLPTVSSFLDEFSGEFPGDNWRIKEGAPAIDADRGNPAPGLSMNAAAIQGRVRSGFIFSTAGPLTVSLDVGTPDFAAGQAGRFEFELEGGWEETEAEFEIRLDQGIIEFEIMEQETEVAFAGDADFHTFTFAVDADQTATWSMDGVVVATFANFPSALARLDLGADNGSTARFVVDNVSLSAQAPGGGAGGGGGGVQDEFSDDFSGDFPGDNWIVKEGSPAVNADLGNPAPGLALGPSTENARVRSAFTFSSADPLTLSFDLGTPAFVTNQTGRFEFQLERDGMGGGEASLELRLDEGRLRLKILDADVELDATADTAFHAFAFSVDADGVATWSVDGEVVLTQAGFPQGLFRIEMEGHGGSSAALIVDNVLLARP